MAGIVIHGLSKVYGDSTTALDGLDLEVQPGELLVVVGPSGSGKTTLLRLVAGLDRPTAGTIRLAGRDLAGVPPRRRDVALVFQSLALYGHLTVEQNLAFALNANTIGGWFRRQAVGEEAKSRIAETARLLGIEHLLDRRPAELSGGEQQRVALGRAIVREPQVLLLDEPLSSLDLPTRRTLRRELKDLQRRLGVPTIYVTHDQAEALALGDRIAVLDQGQLVQVGTPDEIYHRPRNWFVADFFGPQGMNLIEGELKHEQGETKFVALGLCLVLPTELARALPQTAAKLWCGFRPEDVTVVKSPDTDNCLPGTVKTCEAMGDATYLGVGLGAAWLDVTAKLGSHLPRPQIFDVISVQFDTLRMHWFDEDTGDRLPTPDSRFPATDSRTT